MASCTVTGNYGGAGGSTTYYGIVVGPNTAVSGGQTANNLALSHIDFLFVRSGLLLQPGSINVVREHVTMQLPGNQFSTSFVGTATS